MSITENLIQAIGNTSILEWLGVLTSIAYVILASLRNIFCWPFGFLSSSIYVYICYSSNLYLETGLQIFYVGMAVYGWLSWAKRNQQTVDVIYWKVRLHLGLIGGGTMITFGLGYYFQLNTNQASPYLDAAITVFSFLATWMTARRVVEGWIYWIIVDFAAIFLYASRDLYLSSVLYFIFTVMSVSALVQWQRQMQTQKRNRTNHQLIDSEL
jgi:nicotinamide mononucleotide transporter